MGAAKRRIHRSQCFTISQEQAASQGWSSYGDPQYVPHVMRYYSGGSLFGWSSYGDPQYVPHVMRYYSGGSLFSGLFGNQQIVSVAMGQLGNSGGQKFWSWYGFESRVEWCACFASWCAEQSGMVASGQVLKFSSCAVGASWFQGQGRWKGKGYTPSAGDFIFFDWNKDGQVDHVGIVVNVANGRVNTIEGNTSNMVARRSYQLGGIVIVGYGYI